MRLLHRPDLYSWSGFDAARNLDFNSVVWVRPGGNVVIDPMPISDHDRAHLTELGGLAWVVVTNSDHTRAAAELAADFGARVAGPAAEAGAFPFDRGLSDGEALVPGLVALALEGSKTPGELALLLEGTTLITGDLIRCHMGGRLHRLPDPKLADRDAAFASIRRLSTLEGIDAVLVGDGWPIFRGGGAALRALAAGLE